MNDTLTSVTYRHSNPWESPELAALIDRMENVQYKPAFVEPAGHMSLNTSDDACDLHDLQIGLFRDTNIRNASYTA